MATSHGQIDRRINHLRAFGEIHAEEKDIAPAAVRKVHADGRAFAKNRIAAGGRRELQKFRANSQRNVGRMARPEHPLVPSHGSDAATNLIGQSLKRKPMIRFSQRAGERDRGAFLLQLRQKYVESFRVAAVEHMLIAHVRNSAAFSTNKLSRQVKTMNRIQKKEAANSIVKIFAGPSIVIEF